MSMIYYVFGKAEIENKRSIAVFVCKLVDSMRITTENSAKVEVVIPALQDCIMIFRDVANKKHRKYATQTLIS